MKKNIFIFQTLLFLISICFFSCQKEGPPTIITGIVTNKTTGEPVIGVYLDCSLRKPEWDIGRSKDNSAYSDNEGKYQLEIPQEYSFSFSNAYKNGFLPRVDPARFIDIRMGEINVVNIDLIPTDGFLRLNVVNDLPQNDSLYVNFFNPIRASQYALGGGVIPQGLPFHLPLGGAVQKIFAFPSEAFTKVYWGTKLFTPLDNSPFRDSIYLPRNDTVDFFIHF